ncbi:MAG: hypothetical protein IKG15_03645 [Solobacterium sp.]|nr:hypothetical protein [Solobacterium sp.]
MKKQQLCALLAGILLAGCTKDYGPDDIRKYVKDQHGLKSFDLSEEPEEVKGEDDYTDYLWTVTEKDGTVFHVLDNYYWGMEAMTNSLWDDYNDVHLKKFYEETEHDLITLETEENEKMLSSTLAGTYTGRAGMQALNAELMSLQSQKPDGISLNYSFIFDHPYRRTGDYEATQGDWHGIMLKAEPNLSEGENNLLMCCVDQRYPCMYEFSPEEIEQTLSESPHRLGVLMPDGTFTLYPDLTADRFSYGVSFASLFELLNRNGFNPEGDQEHYTFTTKDGSVYEISYAFKHETEKSPEGYYYIKDGEITDMDGYFYNHFTTYWIRERIGLEVYEQWQMNPVETEN